MSFTRDLLGRRLRDPQAKLIHDIQQQLADQAAETTNVVTSQLKGFALKPATKTKSRDKYYVHLKTLDDHQYYTGKYPDFDNCKLFIRAENFGKVYDYSLRNNDAYVMSDVVIPEILVRDETENNLIGYEYVAYFNGNHYINVKDNSLLRIKDIIQNEPTKDGFTFVKRFNPLKYGLSNQKSVIHAEKIDTSQNQYGYSVHFDDKGDFYFYVSYNYRLYFVKLNSKIKINLGPVDFYAQNFNPKNFRTEFKEVDEYVKTLYDLSCSFNFTTKECKIRLKYKDPDTGVIQTLSQSSLNQLPSNLQVHLPLQEGKWSDVENTPLNQVYDSSHNNLVLNISNPDATGVWNEDNTFTNNGNLDGSNTFMTIPNGDYINALTELTWSFWIKRNDIEPDSTYHYIVNKGWNANGGMALYKTNTTSNITLELKTDAGVHGFVTRTNALPEVNTWYFVTVKWKSGEAIKVSINNDPFTSGTVLTGTLTNAANPTVYHGRAFQGNLLYVMFFDKQISDEEQETLYELGPHLAQLPSNKEPQRTASGQQGEITNPFATLYHLPELSSPTIDDYEFINNPSSANPFVPKYECEAGTPYEIPTETPYNVPDGGAEGGNDPFVEHYNHVAGGGGGSAELIYDLSFENSAGDIESSSQWAYGQQILDSQSVFFGETISEFTIGLRDGNSSPSGGTLYLAIIKENGDYITFEGGGGGINPADLTSSFQQYTRSNTSHGYAMQVGDALGVVWVGSNKNGDVDIQRGGENNHFESNSRSCQGVLSNGNSWSNNSTYSMASLVYAGGGGGASIALSTNTSNRVCGIEILAGHGAIGKVITKGHFVLKGENTPSGTVYCRVWDNNGTLIATLSSKTADSIDTGAFTEYIFEDLGASYSPIQAGWRIGIEYPGGSSSNDTIWVQVDAVDAVANARRVRREGSNSWFFHNGEEVVGKLYSGTGTEGPDPYYFMQAFGYSRFAQFVGSGDPLIGVPLTEFKCKLHRESGSIQGELVWKIWKLGGSVVTLNAATLAASSITLTDTVYTFSDPNNTVTLEAGDRIGIEWTGRSGFSAIKIYIMTNFGNHNTADPDKNHNSTASYFSLYDGSWANTPDYDMTGEMKKGGSSFTGVFKFSSQITRVFERAVDISSDFYNQLLTKVVPKVRRTGTIAAPSTLFARIRNNLNQIVQELGSVDANSISDVDFENVEGFVNLGATWFVQEGDYVSFELTGCDATNFIEFQINEDVVNTFHSVMGQYNAGVTSNLSQYDLSGTFYIGGQIDESSRVRVGQFINTQDSLFMTTEDNKITHVEIPMIRKGNPTGSAFLNERDENDVLVKTIDTVAASSLSDDPTNPTIVTFEDLTNTYILAAKNIISVEFDSEDSDQDNAIGVQVRTSSYDNDDSYIARYNGIEYDYITSKKLVALMKTGGNTFTPDPDEPPAVMPQSDTDLYIAVSGDRETDNMMSMEIFDLFVFTSEILTDQQLDNFYFTRNDFESNNYDEILMTNHSFINGS